MVERNAPIWGYCFDVHLFLSGGAEIYKQFGKKSDIGAVQHMLAHYVLHS